MKIKYGEETDTLTITCRDAPIRESDEVRPGTIVDYGHDGGVVYVLYGGGILQLQIPVQQNLSASSALLPSFAPL